MEETRTEPVGRTFAKSVYGDTAEQIELAALDAARGFFGTDLRLEVVHDYLVTALPDNAPQRPQGAYHARVTIKVLD